jgi:hypothetical protein
VGIEPGNAIFKENYFIDELRINGLKGSFVLPEDSVKQLLSPYNIRINSFVFSVIELKVRKPKSHEAFFLKQGSVTGTHLEILEDDTISAALVNDIDFDAQEFSVVSADSMYTISVNGIDYRSDSGELRSDSLIIKPSYKDYDFTSRHQFQRDCIDAQFRNISISDISVQQYLKDKSISCAFVQLETINIHVFRDNREEFDHRIKPIFQNLIYDYPGYFNIDSVRVLNGDVSYTEHAEKGKMPGKITFNDIAATVYKISNDTVHKSVEAFLEVQGKALFMEKGALSFNMKAKLYDPHNTFSLTGSLAEMHIPDINQTLERIAYVSVKSGMAQRTKFDFVADNRQSRGKMIFVYRDLELANVNEPAGAIKSFVQNVVTLVVGSQLIPSNPMPGEEIRVGTIEFERNPERSVFHYCVKSILSGIKSNIFKDSKKTKRSKK